MSRSKDPLAAAMALLAEAGKAKSVDTTKIVVNGHNYRNNDAVTMFAQLPAHFKAGVCKNCGLTFAVNKRAVGFCSDLCRREDWRKTTGLDWRAVSTHDVWDSDPPMIITPSQYAKLKAIAEWFTETQKDLELAAAQKIELQESEEGLTDSLPPHLVLLTVREETSEQPHTEYRDSLTTPPAEPAHVILEQTQAEVDALFGF